MVLSGGRGRGDQCYLCENSQSTKLNLCKIRIQRLPTFLQYTVLQKGSEKELANCISFCQ